MTPEEKYEILNTCIEDIKDCDQFYLAYLLFIEKNVWRVLLKKKGQAVKEDADDLCEEIFTHLFENDRRRLKMYDPAKGSFEGWLKTVIARHTMNWIRKRGDVSDPMQQGKLVQFMDEFGTGRNSREKNQAETSIMLKEVLAAVEQLPPQQKLVFKMYYLDSLSYDQIAEYLHKEKSALYTTISRAIERLKNILDIKGKDFL